jgi:uncharacterized membrane protein
LKTGKLLAVFGLAASSFALFVLVMTPTTVQFIIEGNIVELNQSPSIYNSVDLVVAGFSSFILGSSLIYLLLIDRNDKAKTNTSLITEKWSKLLEEITNKDEQRIIKLIIDEGGTMFQSELVEKTGYSKSKVSLILDRLEAKRILERKRRGMTNAVVLK